MQLNKQQLAIAKDHCNKLLIQFSLRGTATYVKIFITQINDLVFYQRLPEMV